MHLVDAASTRNMLYCSRGASSGSAVMYSARNGTQHLQPAPALDNHDLASASGDQRDGEDVMETVLGRPSSGTSGDALQATQ